MGGEVVVNADDLGVSRGATLGIVQAHRAGIVSSASLAVTTDGYGHALEAVRSCPQLGVGLHFTLSFGRPASGSHGTPMLSDSRGFLRWRFGSLFTALLTQRREALLEQIEIELEAQIERLAGDGITPDHLDSERHIHLIPTIFQRFAGAAERHGIPYVRLGRAVGLGAARWAHWRSILYGTGPVKHTLLSLLTRINRRRVGSLSSADRFLSYLHTGRSDLLIPRLDRLLDDDAVTEVMVHPGIPEESRGVQLGNPELERYLLSDDRRRELQACLDAAPMKSRLKLRTFAQLAQAGGGPG